MHPLALAAAITHKEGDPLALYSVVATIIPVLHRGGSLTRHRPRSGCLRKGPIEGPIGQRQSGQDRIIGILYGVGSILESSLGASSVPRCVGATRGPNDR
jgi:hypothetical protein